MTTCKSKIGNVLFFHFARFACFPEELLVRVFDFSSGNLQSNAQNHSQEPQDAPEIIGFGGFLTFFDGDWMHHQNFPSFYRITRKFPKETMNTLQLQVYMTFPSQAYSPNGISQ